MNKEDYFKYYIQGSDHYLIPRDIFEELFNEMNNWKEESQQLKKIEKEHQKINGELREENKLLKHRLETANDFIESRKENMIPEHYDDLKYIINESDLKSSW